MGYRVLPGVASAITVEIDHPILEGVALTVSFPSQAEANKWMEVIDVWNREGKRMRHNDRLNRIHPLTD